MSDYMGMRTVKRIAAELLGVGESRVRVNPENLKKAEEALTRDDVRALISQGVVYAVKKRGVGRGRSRVKHLKKKAGRRRGVGSRRGGKYARVSRKKIWMSRVRAQRMLLKELALEKKLQKDVYRKVYKMVKGGAFKSRASLLAHLKDAGWVK
jgi:large subunit ribosomal protein L19e